MLKYVFEQLAYEAQHQDLSTQGGERHQKMQRTLPFKDSLQRGASCCTCVSVHGSHAASWLLPSMCRWRAGRVYVRWRGA